MRGDLLIMNNIYIYIYLYIWRSVLIFIAISGHVVPFPYCGPLMDVVVCAGYGCCGPLICCNV